MLIQHYDSMLLLLLLTTSPEMASYFEEHCSDMATQEEERINFLLELARLLRRVLREQNVQLDLPIEELLEEHLTAPPASREFIANLATVTGISVGMHVKVAKPIFILDRCPVCLVDLDNGEINKKLPCKHCFHGECIILWLKKTNSCPVCRQEFPTDNVAYEEYRKELDREHNVDRKHRLEELHGSMFT